MPRLFVLITLAAPLALATVACAGDDVERTVAPTSPATASTGEEGTPDETAAPVRAVAAPDQEAYRLSVIGQGILQETCSYEPNEGVVDCGERGLYLLEPPPEGDDASCVAGVARTSPAGGKPQYVLCSNPAGGESKFYVVEG